MLSSTSVAEKSSVNTKRRFRSRVARLRKEWCDPRIKLHGEAIRMGGKSKKKHAKKKKEE
jgi:hypothetical protein